MADDGSVIPRSGADIPMPAPKVVPFPGKRLDDIPAMLRNMADNIERNIKGGDYENVETVIVLIPVDGDWPRVFGFGQVTSSTTDPALVCEMAKTWLINNLVRRA